MEVLKVKKFLFLSIMLAFVIGLGITACKDDSSKSQVQQYCEKSAECDGLEGNQTVIDACVGMMQGFVDMAADANCTAEGNASVLILLPKFNLYILAVDVSAIPYI